MNLHFPLPKIRTIGNELTLSLAKNSHFSFLPSHFPSLPSRTGHHCGAKTSQWVHTFHCQNFFRPLCSPLLHMARAARWVIENLRQMIKSCPVLFFEKCEFLARESVSSSQIVRIFGKEKCKFIANFSATMVTSLPSISLSLYLSLSLSHQKYLTHNIGSAFALPIIQRDRERRKWRHHFRAKIGDEFTLSLTKNSHNWQWAYTFPCQKYALFVSPFTLPVSPFTDRSPLWR